VDPDYQKSLRFDEYEDIYKQGSVCLFCISWKFLVSLLAYSCSSALLIFLDYHHTRHFVFIANSKPPLTGQKTTETVQIYHVSATPNNNGNYLTLRTNGKVC
jgi:hypothetical protein